MCVCTQESGLGTETNFVKEEMHNVLSLQQIQTYSTTRFGFTETKTKTFLALITLIFNTITLTPSLIYSSLTVNMHNPNPDPPPPPRSISFSFSILKTEGWAGDKRDRRPPQMQNIVKDAQCVCFI